MHDGSADSLHRLEEALAVRARWLEAVRIPKLKDMITAYRSLVESIAGTLLKKGLLREDQYNYEDRVSEVAAPADSILGDSDDTAELSRRMVSYQRQLDFLVDGMTFSLTSLDLETVKKIAAVIAFIDWDGFGEGSHSPTTRALARLVTKVRLSKDSLSSRVLNESQNQVEKNYHGIGERLAELESWHRESWKAEVRAKALPRVPRHSHEAGVDRVAVMLAIRKAFELAVPDGAWHPQLVQEILAEDRDPGGSERTDKLIMSLAVPSAEPSRADDAPRRKTELTDAIHSVCGTAGELERCDEILEDNENELEKRHLGLAQRVRRWFQKSLGRLDDRFYDIEVAPDSAGGPKTETVDFLKFISELKELEAVFAEITEPGSRGSQRVEASDEGQLYDFLDWQLRQLRRHQRRMESLNALFQVRAVHERRVAVRSIKLELLAIENCVNRADEVRRRCLARFEQADTKS